MNIDASASLASGEVYVDGAYLPAAEARVSPFDRGYLFGDGVYEVASVIGGKLIDFPAHMARLERSLAALSLPRPLDDAGILEMMRALIARNRVEEGLLYMQITRGVAPRSFDWPEQPKPVLFAFLQERPLIETEAAARGLTVALVEDRRWRRRDIKTITLLPASWAKVEATLRGADEAWMVEPDATGAPLVTEGSSNNAFIVDAEGRVISRPLSNSILHGVTRAALTELMAREGVAFIERPFTPEEALGAREAFVTSASLLVTPVVRIDEQPIGDGAPGPITRRLREIYIETALRNAI